MDYSTKVELIDRIIYTKLYDVKCKTVWHFIVYVFKTICWSCMVFMREIVTVYFLYKGFKVITGKITGTPTGEGIKIVLVTIYFCIFALILLWILYKLKFKLPLLKYFYSNQKGDEFSLDTIDEKKWGGILSILPGNKCTLVKPDKNKPEYKNDIYQFEKDMTMYNNIHKIQAATDKRFQFNLTNPKCDIHEKKSNNGFFSILFGSDFINEAIIKDEAKKKEEYLKSNPNEKSSTQKFGESIGNFGDRILQKGQNYMKDFTANYEENKPKLGSIDPFTKIQSMLPSAKNFSETFNQNKPTMDGVKTALTKIPGVATLFDKAGDASRLWEKKESTLSLETNIKNATTEIGTAIKNYVVPNPTKITYPL
jgi:hypothetical protein